MSGGYQSSGDDGAELQIEKVARTALPHVRISNSIRVAPAGLDAYLAHRVTPGPS